MTVRRKSTAPLSNFEWTMDDEKVMGNMLQNGRNYKQIASALGRSRKACQERASAIRRRMRDEGATQEEIYKAFPSIYPRRVGMHRGQIASENQSDMPSFVKQKSRAPHPRILPTKERQDIHFVTREEALKKSRPKYSEALNRLLIVSSASALGVWVLAGAFIYSLL